MAEPRDWEMNLTEDFNLLALSPEPRQVTIGHPKILNCISEITTSRERNDIQLRLGGTLPMRISILNGKYEVIKEFQVNNRKLVLSIYPRGNFGASGHGRMYILVQTLNGDGSGNLVEIPILTNDGASEVKE